MRVSMGHECAYLWAMYAHIYGSSNGHVCAYLWEQQWPCMRISMGAAMAMYAHIYGSSNGHECAYLWAMNAHIYGPCMRISMGAAMAMNAYIYRAMYTRISIVVVMAM